MVAQVRKFNMGLQAQHRYRLAPLNIDVIQARHRHPIKSRYWIWKKKNNTKMLPSLRKKISNAG